MVEKILEKIKTYSLPEIFVIYIITNIIEKNDGEGNCYTLLIKDSYEDFIQLCGYKPLTKFNYMFRFTLRKLSEKTIEYTTEEGATIGTSIISAYQMFRSKPSYPWDCSFEVSAYMKDFLKYHKLDLEKILINKSKSVITLNFNHYQNTYNE